MPVYYVERDYKVEIVTLIIKCPECELNMEVSTYSNQSKATRSCNCCEHMIEIKILVCPECNNSAHIKELGHGINFCNTCEKLVSEW